MSEKNGSKKTVEQLIIDNLFNQQVYFVFPTDISASVWAERALDISEKSTTKNRGGAIALERFIAWDYFKSNSIKSQQQDKRSIPTTLRKFFAIHILERNKKEKIFSSLVSQAYADTSVSFKDWITSLLPQLELWHQRYSSKLSAIEKTFEQNDLEDCDLLRLYEEYGEFLNANNLFDPAWEKPPFYDDGKTWYILYPQVLLDFEEYRNLLDSSKNVYIVNVPTKSKTDTKSFKPQVNTFANTREELHALALYIRSVCTEKNIAWQDIALSVPDIETMEPYIRREFELYSIPYQLRSGKKLSQYPAGRLFTLIQACVQEDFSFASVRNLLLDKNFPWQDDVAINQLIEFGIKHNCLCSYEDRNKKVNVWQDAFNREANEERARIFLLGGTFDTVYFRGLIRALTDIYEAQTFTQIREKYFMFRSEFFDVERFDQSANTIISRCVMELDSLIQLQKDFSEAAKCNNPYRFFCSHLDERDYLAQSEDRGVNIFPYKLASSAPFEHHIVIGASQNALSIIHQPLHFLSAEKRAQLGINETILSPYFISLYTHVSSLTTYFSCSNKTFGAYSLPHNDLDSISGTIDKSNDYWVKEKKYYISGEAEKTKKLILHDIQQKGFFNWTKKYDFAHTAVFDTNLITVLKKSIMEYVFDPEKQKIRISPTTLKIYNECPLKWLFSRVLKVTEASLDANLMDAVWIGTIYHEIINRVLEEIKATGICLHLEGENVPEFYIQSFTKHCSAVIDNFPKSCSIDTPMSPLTLEMLKMQKDVYLEKLLVFFTSFCKWFNGCYISSVEEGVSYEPKGKNWFFDGRLDCCLQHAGNDRMDAGKYIVDFKTGTSPSFTESLQTADSDMSDFQLAAYVTLYEHTFTKGRPSVSGAGFFSILKASPTSILGSLVTKNSAHRDQWNPRGKNEYLQRLEPSALGVDFNDSIVQLDVAAQNFAHAVQDENLTHFLQPDFSKISYATCVECPYNSICRTTYTISAEELN